MAGGTAQYFRFQQEGHREAISATTVRIVETLVTCDLFHLDASTIEGCRLTRAHLRVADERDVTDCCCCERNGVTFERNPYVSCEI